MSGSKGWAARVESAAERARRELRETEARCQALRSRLEELRFEAKVDDVLLRAPDLSDLVAMRSWQGQLQRAVEDAEREIFLRRSATRIQAIRDSLSRFAVSDDPTSGAQRAGAVSIGIPAGQSRLTGPAAQDAEARMDRFALRIGEVDDDLERESLTKKAHEILGLRGSERHRGWNALDFEVAAAVKRSRIARRCAAEAAETALGIAHIQGPEADQVRAIAIRVRDQTALAELRAQVELVSLQAERDADAAFVSRQACAVLEELGYEVDAPFESLEPAGAVVHAYLPGHPDHALQVLVNSGSHTMLTSVVARPGTSPEDDVAAEKATCDDVYRLTAVMRERGVGIDLVFHRVPGETPVEHTLAMSPSSSRGAAKKNASRPNAKEREQ